MGLITEEVEMSWNPNNKKWYESKGYNYTKFRDKFKIKTSDLSKTSCTIVNVKCDGENCNHSILKLKWKDYKECVRENGEYYCKICSINYRISCSLKSRFKNSKSFEQWCIENNRQDVLDRWDYELNKKKPCEISYNTSIKFYFKCPRGIHKSELKCINAFMSGQEGSIKCNQCNSIAQSGIDNLGEDFLEKYWDYDKNTGISPWEIDKMSSKKVWWKCLDKKHKSYLRTVSGSCGRNFRCPECVRERDESFLQEKVRLYLNKLGYTILHEYNCNLKCINSKTKHILPYDNEVTDLKFIIEVNGSQHYSIDKWNMLSAKNNNTTPEYELHKQKLYDRYKRIFAKRQGYFYLGIPYWTDNEKETWKKLIDDKINEILSNKFKITA